jgi:hypothetical protein
MNTRQKYLMTMTITAAAGLLLAQPVPDSGVTDSITQSSDSTATLDSDPAQPDTVQTVQSTAESATARDNGKPAEPVLLIKSKNDTVIVITDQNNIQKILQNVSNTVKKSRVQGYGGAGGFSNRLVAFNMGPVFDLVRTDSKLKGISFPTIKNDFRLMSMSGGLGYGGLGGGIRIGGGGYGGSLGNYPSEPFLAKPGDTANSVLTLKATMGFGGLLIEKAIVKDNWNVYLGSFIGGGAIEVQKVIAYEGESTAFSDSWPDSKSGEQASAGFMSTEIHGGATYTIVPWMHIGGDFNVLFYYATSGFGVATSSSFMGITPGIGFRVIFGNIG